ncbi:hypothetical protein [Segniliparus rugosus]|uniref:Uncharacterized protein n=1 Tax=Segniliparus rugosus (strain ATCC BAA-974 / DSM 45345 / CCUG 50838 / CIP 108380 / JCM 13579 / CDC 945) TaxID=679197 RepID=E5XMU6_SEGRC|nr:hypothetical protein [Segniliparus rugosus]EFV14319.1 hypothetical protein HMPREF9336_00816 [Segniliparus rugosus ATCC BAA-974]
MSYLPDFRLTLKKPTWFEVKPESEAGHEDPRWEHVAEATDMRFVVAYGMPRAEDPIGTWRFDDPCEGGHPKLISPSWDIHYAFCVCPTCGEVGIEYEGRGARVCGHDTPDHKGYSYSHSRLLDAYQAARSARFEHGASGS